MDPEKLQQAWQSQSCRTIGTSPDQLLKGARNERRLYFWIDMLIVVVFLGIGAWVLSVTAFQDIQRGWPWLIYGTGLGWVVGYILYNRWRRRRNASHFDDTMLAHVERSIHDIEHQIRLDRTSQWWYTLPIALGCMIPPLILFAMNYGQQPLADSLIPLLLTEGGNVVTFTFVYVVMKYLGRKGLKWQQQELQALQSLRESLLHTDEEALT